MIIVYQETIKLIDKQREKIKMKFNNEINKVAMENAVAKVIKQREEQLKKLQEEKEQMNDKHNYQDWNAEIEDESLLTDEGRTKHKVSLEEHNKVGTFNNCKETSYKNKPIFKDKSSGDINRIILSNDKAKSDLNWSPKISIEEGLQKTSEWFKNNFYK